MGDFDPDAYVSSLSQGNSATGAATPTTRQPPQPAQAAPPSAFDPKAYADQYVDATAKDESYDPATHLAKDPGAEDLAAEVQYRRNQIATPTTLGSVGHDAWETAKGVPRIVGSFVKGGLNIAGNTWDILTNAPGSAESERAAREDLAALQAGGTEALDLLKKGKRQAQRIGGKFDATLSRDEVRARLQTDAAIIAKQQELSKGNLTWGDSWLKTPEELEAEGRPVRAPRIEEMASVLNPVNFIPFGGIVDSVGLRAIAGRALAGAGRVLEAPANIIGRVASHSPIGRVVTGVGAGAAIAEAAALHTAALPGTLAVGGGILAGKGIGALARQAGDEMLARTAIPLGQSFLTKAIKGAMQGGAEGAAVGALFAVTTADNPREAFQNIFAGGALGGLGGGLRAGIDPVLHNRIEIAALGQHLNEVDANIRYGLGYDDAHAAALANAHPELAQRINVLRALNAGRTAPNGDPLQVYALLGSDFADMISRATSHDAREAAGVFLNDRGQLFVNLGDGSPQANAAAIGALGHEYTHAAVSIAEQAQPELLKGLYDKIRANYLDANGNPTPEMQAFIDSQKATLLQNKATQAQVGAFNTHYFVNEIAAETGRRIFNGDNPEAFGLPPTLYQRTLSAVAGWLGDHGVATRRAGQLQFGGQEAAVVTRQLRQMLYEQGAQSSARREEIASARKELAKLRTQARTASDTKQPAIAAKMAEAQARLDKLTQPTAGVRLKQLAVILAKRPTAQSNLAEVQAYQAAVREYDALKKAIEQPSIFPAAGAAPVAPSKPTTPGQQPPAPQPAAPPIEPVPVPTGEAAKFKDERGEWHTATGARTDAPQVGSIVVTREGEIRRITAIHSNGTVDTARTFDSLNTRGGKTHKLADIAPLEHDYVPETEKPAEPPPAPGLSIRQNARGYWEVINEKGDIVKSGLADEAAAHRSKSALERGTKPTIPTAPLGVKDALDYIIEEGGILPKKNASDASKARDYDGMPPEMQKGLYAAALGGTRAPDDIAAALQTHYNIGDGTVTGLWQVLGEHIKARQAHRAQEKQTAAQQRAAIKAEKTAGAAPQKPQLDLGDRLIRSDGQIATVVALPGTRVILDLPDGTTKTESLADIEQAITEGHVQHEKAQMRGTDKPGKTTSEAETRAEGRAAAAAAIRQWRKTRAELRARGQPLPNEPATTKTVPASTVATVEKPLPADAPAPKPQPARPALPDRATVDKLVADAEAKAVAREKRTDTDAAQGRIYAAKVDAIMDAIGDDPNGLHRVTDENDNTKIVGDFDLSNPCHAALVDLAGGITEHADVALKRLQAERGNGVHIRYRSAKSQTETTPWKRIGMVGRKGEYAVDPAAERTEGTIQHKATIPLQTVFKGGRPMVVAFTLDNLLHNAESVRHFMQTKGMGAFPYADEALLIRDAQVYADNHAHGYRGDGSGPMKGFPDSGFRQPDLDYAPQEIPKERFDVLNLLMQSEDAGKYLERIKDVEKKQKAVTDAKPKDKAERQAILNRAVGRMKTSEEAYNLAQENQRWTDIDSGETNELRAKLKAAGFDTNDALKNPFETLDPQHVLDISDESIAQQEGDIPTVRPTGFTSNAMEMRPMADLNAKAVAAAFMPREERAAQTPQEAARERRLYAAVRNGADIASTARAFNVTLGEAERMYDSVAQKTGQGVAFMPREGGQGGAQGAESEHDREGNPQGAAIRHTGDSVHGTGRFDVQNRGLRPAAATGRYLAAEDLAVVPGTSDVGTSLPQTTRQGEERGISAPRAAFMPREQRDTFTGVPTRITGREVSAENSRRLAQLLSQPSAVQRLAVVPASQLSLRRMPTLPRNPFKSEGALREIGHGGEADVFESPEGSVYKIFRTNDDGSMGVEARIIKDAQGNYIFDPVSSTPEGVIDKLRVLTKSGAIPSELHGKTEDGSLIVKQPFAWPGVETDAQRYDARKLSLIRQIPSDPGNHLDYRGFVTVVDGAPYFLTDLTPPNFMRDNSARPRIIDTITSPIPDEVLKNSPRLNAEVTKLRAAERIRDRADVSFMPRETRAERGDKTDDLFAWATDYAKQQNYVNPAAGGVENRAQAGPQQPDIPRGAQAAPAPTDRAIEQAYERAYDLASRIGTRVAGGQHASVIEAAQTAAWDNARRSIANGGRFNPGYMTKSAMRAAGVRKARQPSSLNEPLGEEGEETHQDQLRAEGLTPDAEAAQNDAADTATRLLSGLDTRSQQIVHAVTMEGRTLEDAAAELGISKQRVSVLHQHALSTLRKLMNEHEAGSAAFMPSESPDAQKAAMREDNTKQMAWIDAEAKARGYTEGINALAVAEAGTKEHALYNKLSAQWRVFHHRDVAGKYMTETDVAAINEALYGRPDSSTATPEETQAGGGLGGTSRALLDAAAHVKASTGGREPQRDGFADADDYHEAVRAYEQAQRDALAGWAKANGLFLAKLPSAFDPTKTLNYKLGVEHYAFPLTEHGRWVKFTKGGAGITVRTSPDGELEMTHGDTASYLQRLNNSNAFSGDEVRLHAVAPAENGGLHIITSQPDVHGGDVSNPQKGDVTEADILGAFKEAGFQHLGGASFYRKRDNTAVFDVHENNATKNSGLLIVFDGNVMHPDAEMREAIKEMRFSALAGGHAAFMPAGRPVASNKTAPTPSRFIATPPRESRTEATKRAARERIAAREAQLTAA